MRSALRATFILFISLASFPIFADLLNSEEDTFARDFLKTVEDGKIDAAVDKFTGIDRNQAYQVLSNLSAAFKDGQPLSTELASSRTMFQDGKKIAELQYEIKLNDTKWLLAKIYVQKQSSGSNSVIGLWQEESNHSMIQANKFTLNGKGFIHYLFLALIAVNVLFCLFCIGVAAIKRFPKWWLWSLLCLLAIFRIHLDWTSGQVGIQPISFSFLPFGFFRLGLGPWLVIWQAPVGALICFFLRILPSLEKK